IHLTVSSFQGSRGPLSKPFAACRGEQRKEILYSPVSLLSRTFFNFFQKVFEVDGFHHRPLTK
ncbi:MAG TPA: hypothetical protein H9877_05565, partial [Candidatus Gordonibacter avicola]|nr:hypothetical protein [Candidatus Gordonibacter avicola]